MGWLWPPGKGVWLWTQQLCHCREALLCLGARALLPPRPQVWSTGALREWPGLLPFPGTDVPVAQWYHQTAGGGFALDTWPFAPSSPENAGGEVPGQQAGHRSGGRVDAAASVCRPSGPVGSSPQGLSGRHAHTHSVVRRVAWLSPCGAAAGRTHPEQGGSGCPGGALQGGLPAVPRERPRGGSVSCSGTEAPPPAGLPLSTTRGQHLAKVHVSPLGFGVSL